MACNTDARAWQALANRRKVRLRVVKRNRLMTRVRSWMGGRGLGVFPLLPSGFLRRGR